MRRSAKADVTPIRQTNQYECVATSLYMALKAIGIDVGPRDVAKTMGAKPMVGASWEDAMNAANHLGARATLVIPATLGQVKAWTDRGIPVLIGWNPEGRDWSHASTVFDVVDEEGGTFIYVADPNIPDPEVTVRRIHKDDFYGKWSEKASKYLIRRPAMAIEREISDEGVPMFSSIWNQEEGLVKAASGTRLQKLNAKDKGTLFEALGGVFKRASEGFDMSKMSNNDVMARYEKGKMSPAERKEWEKKHPEVVAKIDSEEFKANVKKKASTSRLASARRVAGQHIFANHFEVRPGKSVNVGDRVDILSVRGTHHLSGVVEDLRGPKALVKFDSNGFSRWVDKSDVSLAR